MRRKLLYYLALILAVLNVFVLYITRYWSLIPIPDHPYWAMAAALLVLYGFAWKKLPDRYYRFLTAFCFMGVFVSFVFYHRVGSDGREYFMQLRSMVMDHDLDLSNDYKFFPGRGKAPYFPFGPALFWAPFYILAHLILSILQVPNLHTGVTSGHQSALSFAAVVYGAAAWFLIFEVLKKYFTKNIALVSVIVLTCATFGMWYWLYEYFMPHTVSLFITTLFLYLWLRWRETPATWKGWFLLGIVGGLMAMGRWQDCVFVLVPAVDELPKYIRIFRSKNWQAFRKLVAYHAVFVIGLFLAFSPQLIFWNIQFGNFTGFLEDYELVWKEPNFIQVLYSYSRGLLTWTPIITICLIGLVLLLWRERRLASLMLLGFLAELYVNSSNSQWWSGASFGARRFVACFLPFALGLSESFRVSLRHPIVAVSIVCAFLVAFNFSVMHRVATGQLSMEGIGPPQQFLAGTVEDMRKSSGISPTFPFSILFGLKYKVPPGRFDELLSIWRLGSWKIDFGEAGDDALLGYGWSDPEMTPGGLSFRWSKGQTSTLLVPLTRATDYDLDLMVQPHPNAVAPKGQVLYVSVNGKHVTKLQLIDDIQEYHVLAPRRLWQSGVNEIRFDYGYTVIPKKQGTSSDTRELAILFNWIKGSITNR